MYLAKDGSFLQIIFVMFFVSLQDTTHRNTRSHNPAPPPRTTHRLAPQLPPARSPSIKRPAPGLPPAHQQRPSHRRCSTSSHQCHSRRSFPLLPCHRKRSTRTIRCRSSRQQRPLLLLLLLRAIILVRTESFPSHKRSTWCTRRRRS